MSQPMNEPTLLPSVDDAIAIATKSVWIHQSPQGAWCVLSISYVTNIGHLMRNGRTTITGTACETPDRAENVMVRVVASHAIVLLGHATTTRYVHFGALHQPNMTAKDLVEAYLADLVVKKLTEASENDGSF